MKEVWLRGCGQCGRDLILKADLTAELRIPEKPWTDLTDEPCAPCLEDVRDLTDGDESLVTDAVTRLMEWCGCGMPESVTDLVMEFLRLTEDWELATASENRQKREALCGGEGQFYLVAYVADALGWTEHGGGVGGEWLTDVGKAALNRYQAYIAAQALEAVD